MRFRRALTLLLMTLVVPGSAQLAAGSARLGRVALRIWLLVIGTLVLLVLVGWVWPGVLATLAFSSFALLVVRVVMIGCAVGWAVLFVDAWRLGDPMRLRQGQRLAIFSLNGVLCVAVCGALLLGSHLIAVQRDFLGHVFSSTEVADSADGRYNVLLLGGDAGATRWGMRPDSLTVASIDAETGRTVLFGLPRNLEKVPFPPDTPMYDEFPAGFVCADECLLNAVYTWAVEHKDTFPKGVDNVGVWATTKTVEEITGLDISYHAMVDMKGFEDLVDAVGGVTVTVPERLPIGGGGGPITGWIEPGKQQLNGRKALWFARSRATTDDYSRMARQKCVMSAMLAQLSPTTVVTRFTAIADASKEIVTTNIPASELDLFVDLARKAKAKPVSSVSFVPPQVETFDPDYDAVRELVEKAVAKSERADESGDKPATGKKASPDAETAQPDDQPSGQPGDQPSEQEQQHKQANKAADLSAACG